MTVLFVFDRSRLAGPKPVPSITVFGSVNSTTSARVMACSFSIVSIKIFFLFIEDC